jgi:hypothetical protein
MGSWLSAQRLGEDVLRLRDGSLRAVLECGAPTSTPGRVFGVLSQLRYPTQTVIQARRPTIANGAPVRSRLRASQAILISRQAGGDTAFEHRVLVVVPWDADEGSDGSLVLRMRADDVRQRLDEANLDPVRLTGRELDRTAILDAVQESRCEVRARGLLARPLIVTRLPDRLRPDSLDALDQGHDLSFHLKPTSRPDRVELSAYATLWTETRDALDVATQRAEALLAADGIRVRRPYLQAEPALVSGTPLCLDLVGARRVLTVDQLSSAGSPAGGRGGHDHALLYGVDPGTRQPLTLDRFALANPNAVVLGDARGRCRLLTLELIRARLAGRHVHMIDATGAYEDTLAALDGRRVVPVAFDAFSVPPQSGDLESRIGGLLAVIELAAGGLTPAARAAIGDAIAFSYAAHGYSYESNDAALVPPVLGEIAAALERRGSRVSASSQPELDALVGKLERYVGGDGRRLFERRPSPPRLGPASVHDLTCLPEQDQPAAGLLSLDQVWRSLPRERSSLVVLDEAHRMVSGVAGQFVARLMTEAAERRVGLTLATHDVAAVLREPTREAVLSAGLTVLLRQTPAAVEPLGDAFRLTPAERSWLLQAPDDEGLLITQDRRLAFRAVASEEEERLISGGSQ